MSRIAPILLTLILVHASPSRAQPGPRPLPDTPAAGRATELLEALGGDVDARRAFVAESLAPGFRERFPMEAHVDQLGLLTSRLGGAERVGVLARGPDEITLAFRTADGEELRLRVTVEPSLPHRVTGLRLEMGRAPGRGLEIASWRDLAARLEAMATDGRFSGVVLAAPGGEIAFHRAYGEADRKAARPVRTDTRFNVGSLMKPLTGVAVLRLAQEGRIELDAPVGRYLEGLGPEVAREVTVRHLLRHRSGLGDYLTLPEFRADPDGFGSVDDLMAVIRDQPLEFEPGSRERYSNSGFVVLGALVEAATGRSYEAVLQDWVFRPAGMTRTSLDRASGDGDIAVAYRSTADGGLVAADDLHPERGSPAGGGYSTAGDLFRFARALLGNRLLEPGWTDRLLAAYDPMAARGAPGGVAWAGGAPGVNAYLAFDPDGTVVVVLANRDPPAASRVASSIMEWLRG